MRVSVLLPLVSLAAVTFAQSFTYDEYESDLSRRDGHLGEINAHRMPRGVESTHTQNNGIRDLSAYEELVGLVVRDLGEDTFMEIAVRAMEEGGRGRHGHHGHHGHRKGKGRGRGRKGRHGRKGRKGRGRKGGAGQKTGNVAEQTTPPASDPAAPAPGADSAAAAPDAATGAASGSEGAEAPAV